MMCHCHMEEKTFELFYSIGIFVPKVKNYFSEFDAKITDFNNVLGDFLISPLFSRIFFSQKRGDLSTQIFG